MNECDRKLFEACRQDRLNKVEKLLKPSGFLFFKSPEIANVNAVDWLSRTPLHVASETGSVEIVQLLIENGAVINSSEQHGNTPLHSASTEGHDEVAKLLISKGADVNVKGIDGDTPLHMAASYGHKVVVELLIANGADVNAVNENDATPLHTAVDVIQMEIAKLLLAEGANVDGSNKAGTPLITASSSGCKEFAKLLIANGADVNAVNEKKETSLQLASKNCDKELVKLLIEHGADVDAMDERGWTALLEAVFKNRIELAEVLLDKGADVHVMNETALYFTLKKDYVALAKLLVAKGADVNALLHSYCATGYDLYDDMETKLKRIDIILNAGADINYKGESGNTSLHILVLKLRALGSNALNKQIDEVRRIMSFITFLVEKGADLHAKNVSNKTPIDLAPSYLSRISWVPTYLKREDKATKSDLKCSSKDLDLNLNTWIVGAINAPKEDHWIDVPLEYVSKLGKYSIDMLQERVEIDYDKAEALFKVIVGGQCKNCSGVISGEQILLVGAYQQADGFIVRDEFLGTLAKGFCPKCDNSIYGIKWIGNNW